MVFHKSRDKTRFKIPLNQHTKRPFLSIFESNLNPFSQIFRKPTFEVAIEKLKLFFYQIFRFVLGLANDKIVAPPAFTIKINLLRHHPIFFLGFVA